MLFSFPARSRYFDVLRQAKEALIALDDLASAKAFFAEELETLEDITKDNLVFAAQTAPLFGAENTVFEELAARLSSLDPMKPDPRSATRWIISVSWLVYSLALLHTPEAKSLASEYMTNTLAQISALGIRNLAWLWIWLMSPALPLLLEQDDLVQTWKSVQQCDQAAEIIHNFRLATQQ